MLKAVVSLSNDGGQVSRRVGPGGQQEMKRTIYAALAVCALMLGTPAFAQQTTGNISGRITDDQNAAVPGVTVTARNAETGFVRSNVTDGEGIYRLTAVPV